MNEANVPVVKNSDEELPIPSLWRPVFRRIADAFAARDYGLSGGVPGVAPVPQETSEQIESYVAEYGETLTSLPDEAWSSSVCIWMGDHWDVLIDLWTEREGRSDLVLSARVREAGDGFETEVYLVYVP